jgi:uncharacterized protein (AIM24 family)
LSTLRVDAIQNRTGGDLVTAKGMARAWVNFNGSGTVAIRSHHNVSSITDNGTGDYTINFSTAMANTNYAASGFGVSYGTADTRGTMVAFRASGTANYVPSNKATTGARILTGQSNAVGQADVTDISFIVFA